ncbi:metallo-beta-lactamase family protein [Gracilibacillus halophilus YIM-C55.5]|uniref:Metallo-beta-lactamase family protein n=1 Tax=Gracilibacillus halophilus YIM-C55.5 TaxID=1308866 RepID=N4WUJ3_9BACI|nr:MBL fold metallo-hydrolase [Gracilibacillus halophilus]ENH98005.1 metallo-beta-lactamase family protein [Gracilibacillus halophilus YIM-C55.5]
MTNQTVSTDHVAKKILQQKPMYLLDVRKTSDFNDWKIESESFTYKNVPFSEVKEDVDALVEELPKDRDIIITCAKGISAGKTAEKLKEAGMENVYPLEGGMRAWSEHLEPVKIADIEGGAIYQLIRLGKGCLSYMVISGDEAAVIDPTRMTDVFVHFAKEKGATIRYAIDTHLHADHISGGQALAEQTQARYYLPPKDATEVTYEYEPLEGGNTITVGEATIEVEALYSPGHTIGSTSLIVNQQFLFTGDILFIDSIGRPDLAGKAEDWVGDLRETLYNRYRKLSSSLIVLPAHFATNHEMNQDGSVAKTLGDLFANNHGLNVEDETSFRKMVTENLPPQPNSYQQIRETNMGKINPASEEKQEMETGPNRCAI